MATRKQLGNDPGDRGEELASEINTQLNREFPDTEDYREAVEAVKGYFHVVLAALDDDERRGRA